MLLQFLTLLCLTGATYSMNDGDELPWSRYSYVVKIISELPNNSTVACTGTVISQSLILTSSKCFEDVTENDVNAVVLLPRLNGATSNRRVTGVSIEGDIAIISIKKRMFKELCPRAPIPARLERIPINASLMSPSWTTIDWEYVSNQRCRILGFRTVAINDYSNTHIMLSTHLNVTVEEMIYADVVEGRGACWDDIGLPLECEVKNDIWMQVGFLHSLVTVEKGETSENAEDTCSDVSRMRFVKLEDTVGYLLDKMGPNEIVSVHSTCFVE